MVCRAASHSRQTPAKPVTSFRLGLTDPNPPYQAYQAHHTPKCLIAITRKPYLREGGLCISRSEIYRLQVAADKKSIWDPIRDRVLDSVSALPTLKDELRKGS